MITIVLLVIAGAIDAFHDLLFHQKVLAYYTYWNPLLSWERKWKDGDRTKGEKFIGSSTIFVMFTDGIHLVKLFLFGILIYAVVIAGEKDYELIETLLFLSIFLISFELSYRIGEKLGKTYDRKEKYHLTTFNETGDGWIEYITDFEGPHVSYTGKKPNAMVWNESGGINIESVTRNVVEEDMGNRSITQYYTFFDSEGNIIDNKDIINYRED